MIPVTGTSGLPAQAQRVFVVSEVNIGTDNTQWAVHEIYNGGTAVREVGPPLDVLLGPGEAGAAAERKALAELLEQAAAIQDAETKGSSVAPGIRVARARAHWASLGLALPEQVLL